ncbi:zinc finger homeobox protein 4-like [Papaver somniferum]|uniref:zinc finger homeobox protein 4-like n=1 Tax=Papaver somniferum TaxID=3469 RepID=UPI000E702BCE|nr:zinc finger homeobox protein 4-like [Papaver somniferum]
MANKAHMSEHKSSKAGKGYNNNRNSKHGPNKKVHCGQRKDNKNNANLVEKNKDEFSAVVSEFFLYFSLEKNQWISPLPPPVPPPSSSPSPSPPQPTPPTPEPESSPSPSSFSGGVGGIVTGGDLDRKSATIVHERQWCGNGVDGASGVEPDLQVRRQVGRVDAEFVRQEDFGVIEGINR